MAKNKLKTHKGASKRFWFTKTRKLKRRRAMQDHFNARETGRNTSKKRRDVTVHQTNRKTIQKLIPNK